MKKIFLLLSIIAVSFTTVSCDSYLDIEPDGKIIPKTVEDYRMVLSSAYSKYPKHKSLTTLRTDEVMLNEYSNDFVTYRDIAMWKDSNLDKLSQKFPWVSFYTTIFYVNQIINEGQKTMESSPERDQLLAEAYALRAYAYFDLINLYAQPYNATTANTDKGVPINLKVDLEAVLKPSSVQEVYKQIYSDINQANLYMQVDQQITGLNYRFSKVALEAFQARIALYQNNWKSAIEFADKAMQIKGEIANLNTSKLAPNNFASIESILALDFTTDNAIQNVSYASNELINSYNAEDDSRFSIYYEKNGSRYTILKGGSSDYKTSFRVAELYFIKAESLLKLDRLDEAKATLNKVIQNRYSATGYATLQNKIASMNSDQFIQFILEERFREFAGEGQRWYDLRRANQKEIKHQISGKEYILRQNDVRYTIEIPQSAKLNNPHL